MKKDDGLAWFFTTVAIVLLFVAYIASTVWVLFAGLACLQVGATFKEKDKSKALYGMVLVPVGTIYVIAVIASFVM